MSGYVARQNEKPKLLLKKASSNSEQHLVLLTSLDKHSNSPQQCVPKLAHFLSKLWGKISGLLAGGQMLLAWILQYEANSETRIKKGGKKKKGGNF